MQIDFQYELSYILVPLSVFLYYYVAISRPILIYHIAIIGFIGAIDTLYKIGNDGYLVTIFSVIIHGALLIVLFDLYKYEFNLYSLLLLAVANIIIMHLPYWPYKLDKYTVQTMYNACYLLLFLIHRYVLNASLYK